MNTEDLVQALQEERQANERLRHQLASAQEIIAQLTTRIQQLEGQKAKDSHNSSKPPSSDGLKGPVQKTKSLRGKSGKSSGGQPGHRGRTLLMVEDPHRLVTLVPATCERCQLSLEMVPITREERAQVWDLPPLQMQVTKYRAQVKACPDCQAETRAAFPVGIKAAAVQYGCADYEARYEQMVMPAVAAHPPPERVAGTRGRPPRGDEVRNLLCRLKDYQPLILRFMHQFIVPFDNHLAERDLRMMKVQKKDLGCFRTPDRATLFCRLRSYLSTLNKQGVPLLTALRHLFLGSPPPPFFWRLSSYDQSGLWRGLGATASHCGSRSHTEGKRCATKQQQHRLWLGLGLERVWP